MITTCCDGNETFAEINAGNLTPPTDDFTGGFGGKGGNKWQQNYQEQKNH
jgi:hypothetical protein